MPDPSEPDATPALPPAPEGATHLRDGNRICLLALSVLLLVLGAGLAYASLTVRWAYYSGVPLTASDLNSLTPAQRADMTIWWGDSMHEGWWCGQWPLIWPALALLSALPPLVDAMRQRAVTRLWSWIGLLGLLCAALGFANVLLTSFAIELSQLNDGGCEFCADGGTVTVALSG